MLIRRRLVRILDSRRTVHERLSPAGHWPAPGDGADRPALRPARDAAADLADHVLASSDHLARGRRTPALRPRRRPSCTTTAKTSAGDLAGPSSALPIRPTAGSRHGRRGRRVVSATRHRQRSSPPRRPRDAVTCRGLPSRRPILASAGYDRTSGSGMSRPGIAGHRSRATRTASSPLAFSPDGTDARLGRARTGRCGSGMLEGRRERAPSRAMIRRPRARVQPRRQDARVGGRGSARRSSGICGRWPRKDIAGPSRHDPRGRVHRPTAGRSRRPAKTARSSSGIARSGRERATLTGHGDMVLSLAFSPARDDAGDSGGLDAAVKLWDPKTGRERATLPATASGILALAFAPGRTADRHGGI